MDEEHQHRMIKEDYPAVKSAKKTCCLILIIALIAGGIYIVSPPPIKHLISTYDFWPCVVLGGIAVIALIRAASQSCGR